MTLTSSSETDNLLELYRQDVYSKIVTVLQIMPLKEKWKKQDISTRSTNAINDLKTCNADLFPNVWNLLIILTTL